MHLDVEVIKDRWIQDQPSYSALGKVVHNFLLENIPKLEILPDISFRTKELISIIKKIKRKRRERANYDYDSLNDKLGLRIICDFQEDLYKVDGLIKENFFVKSVEYKQEELNFDKLDYVSNHYDLNIDPSLDKFRTHSSFAHLKFEVQVRTLNQHVWSNISHKLAYKQNQELPANLKRRIYRLLSLYEIADDEFSSVNKQLKNTPSNLVFAVINMLEGKFYRYANMDYDRKTSIEDLAVILSYFSKKEQDRLFAEMPDFLSMYDSKIERIYKENKERYFEIPLLTQPEVFVIWYALEAFQFSLTDNWANDFDFYDLERVALIWGTSLS